MIHLSGLNLDKTPLYLQISLSDEQLKMIKGVTQELSVLQEQQKKLDQLQKLEDLSRGNAAGRGPPRQQGLDMISSYNQDDDEVWKLLCDVICCCMPGRHWQGCPQISE